MPAARKRTIPSIAEILQQLRCLPETVRMVWQAAGVWILLWALSLVVLGVTPGLLALQSRDLIDAITGSLDSGRVDPTVFAWQAGLFALIFVLNEVFKRLLAWAKLNQSERIRDHLTSLIHSQSLRLDMFYYDSPRYYDLLHRARVDAVNRPVVMLENAGSLVRYAITFFSLAGILMSYAAWLPFAIILGALPSLLIIFHHTRELYFWKQKNTSRERLQKYFDWVLSLRQAAEELRVFQLGGYFQDAYSSLRTSLRDEHLRLQRSKLAGELLSVFLSLGAAGLVMVWILVEVLNGRAGLGDLALFYQVYNQGQQIVGASMASVSDFLGNLMYLGNLFEFLELEPTIRNRAEGEQVDLPEGKVGYQFSNVTFIYPDSKNPALHDFSLVLNPGEITAIVGENGAGKTTLLKLLCRFYDPEEGSVLLNGTDLREYDPEDLYSIVSVLFQVPVRYHTTAHDNIHFGDLALENGGTEVERASMLAGSHEFIKRFPQGYQTILGKWFGGAELSGGEWQRLALARAFLRNAPVLLLDEPTSDLDSWAEMDWFERFRQLAEGRTSVIITHRFTTAMQADIIHVMKEGRIVESGTHRSLMEQDGLYASSWKAQMREAERAGG